ncbi:MAG TPA: diguanylate cyclase [Actinomycetota bacterium]|nr:diguanylate cyclase [Actinomycetota bacterium]
MRESAATSADPVQLDGRAVTTGAAIGISLHLGDARDARTLMQQADLAMYSVKRAGRARASPSPAIFRTTRPRQADRAS